MYENKPHIYTQSKKGVFDWTDKNNFLIHYRMLKFYVRHRKVVDKVREIISFRQRKWLGKFINILTQKRNKAKNDFEQDLITFQNADNRKNIKQPSNLNFNGIHKSYTNYDSYAFQQNEVMVDKSVYFEYAIPDLRKLNMYESYYDKLQPDFGEKHKQLHYMDCDSFVLSITTQNIFIDFWKYK